MQVFVGNLPPEAEARDLRDFFRDFGQINDAWVARKPPGFAFVWFEDERDAVLLTNSRARPSARRPCAAAARLHVAPSPVRPCCAPPTVALRRCRRGPSPHQQPRSSVSTSSSGGKSSRDSEFFCFTSPAASSARLRLPRPRLQSRTCSLLEHLLLFGDLCASASWRPRLLLLRCLLVAPRHVTHVTSPHLTTTSSLPPSCASSSQPSPHQ